MKNRWLGTLINALNITSRVLMLIAQKEVTSPRGLQVAQTKEQGHILRVFFYEKNHQKISSYAPKTGICNLCCVMFSHLQKHFRSPE